MWEGRKQARRAWLTALPRRARRGFGSAANLVLGEFTAERSVVGAPSVGKDGETLVGVRLNGKGRTLYYKEGQCQKLTGLSRLGVSAACLRAFCDAHAGLLRGLSCDAVWQHIIHAVADRCHCSLAAAIGHVTYDTRPDARLPSRPRWERRAQRSSRCGRS